MENQNIEHETSSSESSQNKQNNFMIPGAIIVAGVLIAGAVFFSNQNKSTQVAANNTNTVQRPTAQQPQAQPTDTTNALRPISSSDHIKGNPNAAVKIVEYSDMECPFCKRFHQTMQRVVDEYDGQVAWVYRHFPLDQLHPVKARAEAVASECANELGGNDAFWQFTDRFFELTPSNNQTDIDTVLPQIAQEIGIDQGQFQSCLESGKYDSHIQDDVDDAATTGGRGTPWSVVVAENGQTFPLSGAQPYASVKQLVDIALQAQ